MALKFSKCQHPGICNSCPKTAKYYIQAGTHRLLLCYDCSRELMNLIRRGTEGNYQTVMIDEMHMKEVSHDDIRTKG